MTFDAEVSPQAKRLESTTAGASAQQGSTQQMRLSVWPCLCENLQQHMMFARPVPKSWANPWFFDEP